MIYIMEDGTVINPSHISMIKKIKNKKGVYHVFLVGCSSPFILEFSDKEYVEIIYNMKEMSSK